MRAIQKQKIHMTTMRHLETGKKKLRTTKCVCSVTHKYRTIIVFSKTSAQTFRGY